MSRLVRFLRPYRRPEHIGWGGDLTNPFMQLWEPSNKGEIR